MLVTVITGRLKRIVFKNRLKPSKLSEFLSSSGISYESSTVMYLLTAVSHNVLVVV